MKKRLRFSYIIIVILLLLGFSVYQYHIYKTTELRIYNCAGDDTTIWLHGKESRTFQNIFINKIKYFADNEFKQKQERFDWTVVYRPPSFSEYALHKKVDEKFEDILLNFTFYDDEKNERIIVLGCVYGAIPRFGAITGEDYQYLKELMGKRCSEQGVTFEREDI